MYPLMELGSEQEGPYTYYVIMFGGKGGLSVGKFTPHPPLRSYYIFLEKVGFEEIFQQLIYRDISELHFFHTCPSLKLSFSAHQAAVSESLIRLGGEG